MTEEIHSSKLGVRVVGLSWMILSAASTRGVAKRSWTMASNFPHLSGTGVIGILNILSGKELVGLEGVILPWESSSSALLMVLGDILMWRLGWNFPR